MSRTLVCTLAVATALILGPPRLSGQRSAQLLADAREQIQAQKLDSAITLLHAITTDQQADSSDRAEAFLWLGVATFYLGKDSAASDAFRGALANEPLLMPDAVLAKLDSVLAALWEHEQTAVLCGESLPAWLWPAGATRDTALNGNARTARGPQIRWGPRLPYPDNLRRADIQGRVWARVIIDTLGRPERGSVRILNATHPDFARHVTEYTEQAHYTGAVSSAGRIRSCLVLSVDFSIRH